MSRRKNSQLTAERLRELLHYDSTTGVWTWRITRSGRIKIGTPAGYIEGGYLRIKINMLIRF